MAITNAKNNYLTRLFGTPGDKSRYAQQEEEISQTTPVMQPMAKSPMMSQMLAGFTRPGMEQVQQGEAPVIPITQNPVTQGDPQPNAMKSRYQMLQMSEEQPTRNTEEEEIIKKRARMNAFGKGISALAGLAGVAVGGDAPVVPDLQTPWYMNQMQTLDQDYRGRLQDWTNRRFQVDAANNQIVNREIDQEIDAENAMARVQLQGEIDRQLAEQRAQYDLQKLEAQGEQKLIEAMQAIGVDPYSKNAYKEFLDKRTKQFETEIKYDESRIGYNNRYGSGRAGAGKQTYDLPTLQKGRQRLLGQYDQQIKALNSQLTGSVTKDAGILEQIKQLQAEKKRYYEYNPGSNELLDAEVMDSAYQMEEDGIQESSGNYDPEFQLPPSPYSPGQGFNMNQSRQQPKSQPRSEKEVISAMNSNRKSVLDNAQRIASIDFENPDPETANLIIEKAQELVELGVFEDEDSAIESIINLAKSNVK